MIFFLMKYVQFQQLAKQKPLCSVVICDEPTTLKEIKCEVL